MRQTEKFLKGYEEVMGVTLTWRNLLVGFAMAAGLLAALALGEVFGR